MHPNVVLIYCLYNWYAITQMRELCFIFHHNKTDEKNQLLLMIEYYLYRNVLFQHHVVSNYSSRTEMAVL